MDYGLDRVRRSLLHGLRVSLGPEQGWEAFERHQLLAIRFHRAARLNSPTGFSDRNGWCRYFDAYFPRGGEHGKLLFERWRSTLLKDEMPGRGVAITHAQPEAHFVMTDLGLCINLESMWNDFELSVDRFVDALGRDEAHRQTTLAFLDKTRWIVRPVAIPVPRPVTALQGVLVPASVAATAMVVDMTRPGASLEDSTGDSTARSSGTIPATAVDESVPPETPA
jgi:hypothetical protein